MSWSDEHRVEVAGHAAWLKHSIDGPNYAERLTLVFDDMSSIEVTYSAGPVIEDARNEAEAMGAGISAHACAAFYGLLEQWRSVGS